MAVVNSQKLININNDFIGDDDALELNNSTPSIDLRYGGQYGFLPYLGNDEGSTRIQDWVNNAPEVSRDVIPILIQPPKGFELFPASKTLKGILKALVEVHSKAIDGLNSSLTVETAEVEMGKGLGTMKVPTKTTYEQTSVTHNFGYEKQGGPYRKFLDLWIRYLIKDPQTDSPLITHIVDEDKLPVEWTPEWYSMTVLYIKPNYNFRKVELAWLVSNLFPNGNPDITGKKDITAGGELKEVSVEFGGFTIPPTNRRVLNYAQQILDSLSLYNKNPEDILLPVNNIDSDLEGLEDLDVYYQGEHGQEENNG